VTVLLEIDHAGVRAFGEGQARALVKPASRNHGDGDVRKKIVPVVKPPSGPSVADWEGGRYLSLEEWLSLSPRAGALLLQPSDDIRKLEGKLEDLPLIAIDFHRIADGRGYSQAYLLRNRVKYEGALRAVGAVAADQLQALAAVGFDSFELRAGEDAGTAASAFNTFSVFYQGAVVAGSQKDRDDANFLARVKRLERALAGIAQSHSRPALASSLSAEDLVITDAIARLNLPIDVFTLDTGRLHDETLALIPQIEKRYGLAVEVFKPDPRTVADYVAAYGENGFYDGVAERKRCCGIRKVEPLGRALKGRDAWLTGQRREQATTRTALPERERDGERGMEKFNPLADWSWADILAYAERYDIPMSALYDRGYVSIGCEPCTRPVRAGEDPRNGRWWWENKDGKECGLHAANAAAPLARRAVLENAPA
jgi:phosphoadenosine phosphosulfate reductase